VARSCLTHRQAPPPLWGRLGGGWPRTRSSRLPSQEIADQRQPEGSGSFPGGTGCPIAGCHLPTIAVTGLAIIGAGDQQFRAVHGHVIGMDEIGVQPGRSDRGYRSSTGWARVTSSSVFQPICGTLRIVPSARSAPPSPGIQPRPLVMDFSLALGRHQLHADADAEERPRHPGSPRSVEHLDHAGRLRRARRDNRRRRRHRAARCDRRDTRSSGSRVTTIFCGIIPCRAPRARTPSPPSADCRSRNR
jgi:hypothetical protein